VPQVVGPFLGKLQIEGNQRDALQHEKTVVLVQTTGRYRSPQRAGKSISIGRRLTRSGAPALTAPGSHLPLNPEQTAHPPFVIGKAIAQFATECNEAAAGF